MQEAEDLLRWALDGLHAELGEQKIATCLQTRCEVTRLGKFIPPKKRSLEARLENVVLC